MDRDFENICAIMEKSGFKDVDKMTAYKFFHRLQALEEQNRKKK